MSVTWANFRAQTARFLNDESYQKYSQALLMDGVNDALRAFASTHTGVMSDFEINGDGTVYTFALPSNIIDPEDGVYAVQWADQEWLRREFYWPGNRWPSASRTTSSSPRAYVLWPTGHISFGQVPSDGDTVTVHYVAYYDVVDSDSSVISVPNWALEAIKLYVASEALGPGFIKAGQLGQYKSRREAGKPEDNPLLRLAEHYMVRYYQILSAHPAPQWRLVHPMGES